MSFSYDPALAQEKDQIRFLVQDTDEAKAKFQDEEIAWVLSQEANSYMAAARLCDILVTKAGGVKSKRIGELAISYDPVFYNTLASQLRSRGLNYQTPYAGGISVTDKELQRENADATTPSFVRRIEDNPAAPQPEIPPLHPLSSIQ